MTMVHGPGDPQYSTSSLDLPMILRLSTVLALLTATKLSLAAPNSPTTSSATPTATSVAIPTFICFPPGDPLSEIFSIVEIGQIVGATGVTVCPLGAACDAPTTEELEIINNAMQTDPDLDFIVALLRDEEPGAAIIGVSIP